MSVGVIIVAGGRGERLGDAQPKQLLDVGGRTILRRSIDAFETHPLVSHLVVVLPEALMPDAAAHVGRTSRPCAVVAGGPRRQDSVRHGFAAVPPGVDVVLVHDAARPFVTGDVIDRVIAAAREAGAAVPALPARDTVKHVAGGDGMVTGTIRRDEVWLAQTPQGFQRAILAAAVARGERETEATDEAFLVEAGGGRVRVVMGDERNVKITTADDLAAARQAMAPILRVGTGYDLHRLVPGRRLVLAGVEISTSFGPASHSDGDVLCHALIDAMLGAAAAGDIGTHFPNTDPAWKDTPGLDLLARTVGLLSSTGWRVSSVDVTVVLERPKLGPHVAAIRDALSRVIGVPVPAVGVKAKTNEGVDAVGRGEAIAAQAVAVLTAGGPM